MTAQEVEGLRDKTRRLGELAEKHMDLDGLLDLMRQAPAMEYAPEPRKKLGSARVAVARDRAFCFYYEDSLDELRDLGAELIDFSPLTDSRQPENIPFNEKDFSDCCKEAGFVPLDLSDKHVLAVNTLSRPAGRKEHSDPFDRMLLAQAKVENISFLTHDTLIPDYAEKWIIPV